METFIIGLIEKNPILKYLFAFGFGIVVAEYLLAFFDIRPKTMETLSDEISRLELDQQATLINLIQINMDTKNRIDEIGKDIQQ